MTDRDGARLLAVVSQAVAVGALAGGLLAFAAWAGIEVGGASSGTSLSDLLSVGGGAGAVFGGLIGFLAPVPGGSAALTRPATLEERVEKLGEALVEASQTLKAIEAEISSRQRLVQRLAEDAAVHEQLLAVSREEAEAVAQTLRIELTRSDRRARREQILFGLVFFALGVAASVALALLGVGG